MFSTKDVLASVQKTYADGLSTIARKNHDYAGEGDPFANFRAVEILGLSTEQGFLVRMLDKIMRLSNLIDAPPAVTDESFTDTCLDLANYAALLKAFREEQATELNQMLHHTERAMPTVQTVHEIEHPAQTVTVTDSNQVNEPSIFARMLGRR